MKNGKRIIPVVCRDVDYRDVRKELASLNWIFFRAEGDDFNNAVKLLLKALDAGELSWTCSAAFTCLAYVMRSCAVFYDEGWLAGV